jgi:isopropylmalate/homocitrate/citramalate synthase
MNKINKINILDCTLRDGGYINNWEFSTENTKEIIKSLIKSKVEIVECGFVSQKQGKEKDSTQFISLTQVNELLNSLKVDLSDTQFCVMINKGEYDLNDLPIYNPKTDNVIGIRYAFHKKDWREALVDTKIIIEKGYKVYVQAMVTLSYSDAESLQMIEEINKYDVYAMYIVDSFGAMFGDDFRRLHYLFENNLRSDIKLGYHSHNNLQLAYSNAIDFIQTKNIDREIIIDSSIHGMGRGAGNLTTELLADFLNKKKHTEYNIIPLLETIDKYLEAIYRENYWGYSIAHFLSASFRCHPNYSSFLVKKKNLPIVDIQKILGLLDNGEKKNFNKDRIAELYLNFKSNDGLPINFNVDFFKDQNILIIAPGPNLIKQKETVENFINTKKPLVIAVNHIPKNLKTNYFFFSNQKRYDKFIEHIEPEKVIITTNIHVNTNSSNYKVVDYHTLATKTSNKNDNVTILLLNLLIDQKVKEVYLAGFDGYKFDSDNYSYTEYDRIVERKVMEQQNENIVASLKEVREKLSMNFITESVYN